MNSNLTQNLRELYRIQRRIDSLNREKVRLREAITDDIIEERLQGRRFTVGDRKVAYVDRTITQPLTNRYIKDALYNYFKGDNVRAEELYDYLMVNREKIKRQQLEFTKIPKRDKNYI